jgi:hypothetical protein
MIPGNAGGAGIGSFNIANTKPTTAPVINDKRINFMYMYLLSYSADWMDHENVSFINMALMMDHIPFPFLLEKHNFHKDGVIDNYSYTHILLLSEIFLEDKKD